MLYNYNVQSIKMENSPKSGFPWNFTTVLTKDGYRYVKAYRMKWDPVLKKSKRCLQRHVGRLFEDGRIKISPKFSADFPEYAGDDWFWGIDKKPVPEAQYRQDFPETPGPAPEDEEACQQQETLDVGLTWAAVTLAEKNGIRAHLHEVFGKEMGEELLYLAIFKLAGGGSMMTYDLWRQKVWLPKCKRLTGQRISEILAAVDGEKVVKYFRLRHNRQDAVWEEIYKRNPALRGRPIEYALDNTSISTYSDTIAEAQFGHAKRDPDLKQINYTVICDQCSGDIVFAHMYEGAVNDVTALSDILHAMTNAGFDLDKNILVTDRGYSSLENIQKMINLDLKYLQGVRFVEDSLKQNFERHKESLRKNAFFSSKEKAYAFTLKEPWSQNTDYGRLKLDTYVHLFRLVNREDETAVFLSEKADEIIRLKNENKSIPQDLWNNYRRFVDSIKDSNGNSKWVRKSSKIDEAVETAGYFALRSNSISDAFEALSVYRQRGMVEQDFNQLKNWLDCDRLRVGAVSVQGKLLVSTIGTALRMMMLNSAKQMEDRKAKLVIPGNSMDRLLAELTLVRAHKRNNANAWIRNSIPASRRRCFELLQLSEPPRRFEM